MPKGVILDDLQDTKVPYAAAHEVMKMKILAAHKREDVNKGRGDLDDVMALLKDGDSLTYDNDDEKAACKVALEKFIGTYIKQEREWTVAEWKNTNLE